MREDLSLDPQIHMKHQTGLAHTNLCPVLVRVRTEIGRSLGLLVTSLAKRQATPDLVRDCLKGLKYRAIEEDTQHLPLASTCIDTQSYAPVHSHVTGLYMHSHKYMAG